VTPASRKTGLVLALGLLTCLTAYASPAAGQTAEAEQDDAYFDMPLEQLMEIPVQSVTTASKYEQKTTEAPSSVTIITAEEIRLYGYRTLADVLRSVVGFYTSYDRSYERVGVRGFSLPGDVSTRTLILVDGNRMNENVQNFGAIGEGFILDLDLIKQIEIVRGPGSALYGGNAIFAVINVITKKGKDFGGVELAGDLFGLENSLRNWDAGRGRVTYGKQFENGLDLLFSATTLRKESPNLIIPHFSILEELGPTNSDDEDAYKLFSKLTFGELTVEAALVNREKEIPTGPLGVVFEDEWTTTKDDKAGFVALTWEHDLSSTLSMKARSSLNFYKHVFTGQHTGTPWDDVNGFYINPTTYTKRGQWWNNEVQFSTTVFEKHRLTTGVEFQYTIEQDQNFIRRSNDWGVITVDEDSSWKKNLRNNWYGVYLQDEWRMADDLTVNAGLRWDYYEGVGGTTNPRVAVIKNLSDATTLKLLYGTAFRAPTAHELYYQDEALEQEPALDLKSETIETYEAVLEHYFDRSMRGSVSLYHYKLLDFINQRSLEGWPPGLMTWENAGKVEATGVELGLEKNWKNGMRGRFSYSFARTKYYEVQWGSDSDEDEPTDRTTLPNSPQHMVKGNLIIPLIKDKLFAGLEAQYYSRRSVLSTVPEFDRSRGRFLKGYIVTNLTLTWKDVVKNLELAFAVRNLFDEKYYHPAWGDNEMSAIEQDGRTFLLTARYRF